MEVNAQYSAIVKEIEQKLYRKLTIKERDFVKWMIKKDQLDPEELIDASDKIISIDKWRRNKFHLPYS